MSIIMDINGLINVGMELFHGYVLLHEIHATVRSKPRPKPECGTEPCLRNSKYQAYASHRKSMLFNTLILINHSHEYALNHQ